MRIVKSFARSSLDAAALLFLVVSAVTARAEANPAHIAQPFEPPDSARVIVKFRSGSPVLQKHALPELATPAEAQDAVTARANALGSRLGMKLTAGRAIADRAQVIRAEGVGSAELAARVAAESDVEYAVVDQRRFHHTVPNDPLYTQGPAIGGFSGGPVVGQWYLRAPAGDVASSINAPAAWDLTTGSPGIVVAVLDTGVRPEHPDLAGKLLPGYDMILDAGSANDGDARDSDASDPGDWITAAENADTSGGFYNCGVENSSWHGTMTSSLIGAASNNGVGMSGVAWNVKLLPVRVLGKCGGLDSDIIAGMRWAAGLSVPGLPLNPNPARVINMSLGAPGACALGYADVMNAIGSKSDPVVVVASAGNSTGHEIGTPANCAGVIAVAGLRHVGTKVGFSDLGPQISISAPAGNCVNTGATVPCLYPILAANNTGTTTAVASSYTGSFNPSVGTSFSAPLVAGTAALMLSVKPLLTPADIKAALKSTARPFPALASGSTVPECRIPDGTDQVECHCTTSTCGAGMLDAGAAVRAVMPAAPLPQVVEFYNSILDNYFITADPNEQASIDNGAAGAGWTRTGNTFSAGGTAQVCRFYGSISPGPNSHFYTIDPDECSRLKQAQALTAPTQKRWNFESLDFASTPTLSGGCAAGTVPVYRAYNNGFARGVDSNHRLTSNTAAIQEVVARGWISEGVVMCAPGPA